MMKLIARRAAVLSLAALLWTAVGGAALAGIIQSPSGEGLALVEDATGYRVESPDGLSEPLAASGGSRLTAFHELEGGWMAAGSRWTEAGQELVLIRRQGEVVEAIETPASSFGLQSSPVPLVERGVLVGLAWLEGDGGEKNAIMAASWSGGAWSSVETVSPLNEDGQLAVSGAVLDDGSRVLVWAAVEGGDSDIWWSLSKGVGWSPPARVHADNAVPDVIPRVAATDGGALVAWSQREGRIYRLRIWKLHQGTWRQTAFVGEDGSFDPSLFPVDQGVGFLYRVADRRSWALVDVAPSGRVRQRAAAGREQMFERPLVVTGPGQVSLRAPLEVSLGRSDDASFEVELEWIPEP